MKQVVHLLLALIIVVNPGSSSATEVLGQQKFEEEFRQRSEAYAAWFAKLGKAKYGLDAEQYKASEKGYIHVCMDWLQGEDLLDDATYMATTKKLENDPRVLPTESAVQDGWDLVKQRFEGLTKTRRLQINNKAGPYFRLCGGG